MRKTVCRWVGVLALAVASLPAASGGGLQSGLDGHAWDGLKGRLAFGTTTSVRTDLDGSETEPLKVNSLSVMGDYYPSRARLGSNGGLRATSGVLFGTRTSLWSSPASVGHRAAAPARTSLNGSEEVGTLPYLGVGYTGYSSKGGWGLSADLGLMALNPRSAAHLGKVFGGTQTLDEALREMRFSPLVQLGVSYSF